MLAVHRKQLALFCAAVRVTNAPAETSDPCWQAPPSVRIQARQSPTAPRKTDNPGDDNIDRSTRQRRAGGLAYDDFDSRTGQRRGQFPGMRLGCKPDGFGTVPKRLFGKKAGMGPGHEDFYIKLVRAGFDKREVLVPIDPVDPKIEICFVTSQTLPARRYCGHI